MLTYWAFVAFIVWGATLFCRGLFRGGHFTLFLAHNRSYTYIQSRSQSNQKCWHFFVISPLHLEIWPCAMMQLDNERADFSKILLEDVNNRNWELVIFFTIISPWKALILEIILVVKMVLGKNVYKDKVKVFKNWMPFVQRIDNFRNIPCTFFLPKGTFLAFMWYSPHIN